MCDLCSHFSVSPQLQSGDSFWGLIKCKLDEEGNVAMMRSEDEYTEMLRANERTAILHKKWKELDKQGKANAELVKAKKEEKARKDYIKIFMNATDSAEVINHVWATRPTLVLRHQDPFALAADPKNKPGSPASHAGFRLNVFGTDDFAPTAESGRRASPQKSKPISSSTQTFHSTQSRSRGKKVVALVSKQSHYTQEPFERFGAHKVRPARTTPVDGLATSQSDGSLLSNSGPRPKLQDRLGALTSTYMNATPAAKTAGRNRVTVIAKPPTHPDAHNAGYVVDMGLFHGKTVAGGGKRLSVVAPVVPRTQKQLEQEHFDSAFHEMRRNVDKSGAAGVDKDVFMEALVSNQSFKSMMMGTVMWPLIKGRKWEVRARAYTSKRETRERSEHISFARTLYVSVCTVCIAITIARISLLLALLPSTFAHVFTRARFLPLPLTLARARRLLRTPCRNTARSSPPRGLTRSSRRSTPRAASAATG